MKKVFLLMIVILCSKSLTAQYNYVWLIGYDGWVDKGRILYTTTSYNYTIETRKMGFEGTEATICDSNGNFLMSSNGVWIANANNDTMMNGSGLNPNWFTTSWHDGLPIPYGNIILPFPGDSSKYVLLHQTGDSAGVIPSDELLYSVIDITLDNGLGGVISKNDTVLKDSLNFGIAACKHANGRDWWIVVQKDSTDIVFKFELTPTGIQNLSFQHLNVPIAWGNVTQPTFSQDGKMFAYYTYDPVTLASSVLLFDFDRCTGIFSNERIIPTTSSNYLWGLAFSSTGKFLYTCSSNFVFQIDVDSLTLDTVATYDGFCYPSSPWCTTFFHMYLAANGKIYITSGSGVQYIHEMNYPDSANTTSDVQQHAIFLNTWSFRAVPNHPNYNLGCDTTSGCPCLAPNGLETIGDHNFKLKIFPNPTNGSFSISYLLPQNKSGKLELIDVNGKIVYRQNLPQWSTLQNISLPKISSGIYALKISSNNYFAIQKIIVSE